MKILSDTKILSSQQKNFLLQFQKKLGLRFKNLSLLNLAFHHRSFSNESTAGKINNEKLEFLGDAVLGMVVAAYLYEVMSDKAEGDLAKIKSFVVCENTLSEIARRMGVDEGLILGKGEELSGGRKKKALLADALEAIIGAVYLDAGYKIVQNFVLSFIIDEVEKVVNNKHSRDYKTMLQEFCQKKYKLCPVYELDKKIGPEHDHTFWINLKISDKIFGPACGKNKKEAEQAAARLAWDFLQKN
ncbi:MAG: ribonuclease III [Treponemataceae bacterium]